MNQYRKIDRTRIQFDFLNVYSVPIACEAEIRNLGGYIYHLNMSRRSGILQYRKNLDSFFREYGDRFDIIHCNYQSLVNIDLLKYAKKYGIIGRIAHSHNKGYGTEPNIFQKTLIAINKRTIFRYATTYFACSASAGEWMFGHKQSKIIYNAIDTKAFLYNKEMRDKIRMQYGIYNEKLVVFVGRLDPQKNPLFVVDIFNEINKRDNNWRLFIIGDGILRGDVEERVSRHALQDKVQLLGSRSDVNIFLQAADCFLFPSKFEGLGIALIEAQAASLKCFTSKDAVPNEVDVTGLIEFIPLADSASDWAQKIMQAEKHERVDQFNSIKQAGYDSDSNIKIVEEEYISLVDSQ